MTDWPPLVTFRNARSCVLWSVSLSALLWIAIVTLAFPAAATRLDGSAHFLASLPERILDMHPAKSLPQGLPGLHGLRHVALG
ncbi:hypothetical protein [Novosphingobium sp.]|uniref:hypothetical protein n=1 Tax=Novosphingobium sp. TaxID=1874826 RepID=UPI0038B97047